MLVENRSMLLQEPGDPVIGGEVMDQYGTAEYPGLPGSPELGYHAGGSTEKEQFNEQPNLARGNDHCFSRPARIAGNRKDSPDGCKEQGQSDGQQDVGPAVCKAVPPDPEHYQGSYFKEQAEELVQGMLRHYMAIFRKYKALG